MSWGLGDTQEKEHVKKGRRKRTGYDERWDTKKKKQIKESKAWESENESNKGFR